MTEQRTSEGTAPIGEATQAPPAEPPVGEPTRTVEQVEAEYRARQAGKDRENAALRTELDRYKSAETQRMTEAQQRQAAELGEVEALKRQLAEEKAGRVSEVRSVRFPNAADVLDPSALAAMDEAKLVALEERLRPKGTKPESYVDPNSPPRHPAQGQPGPKSVADLKADLERMSPEYVTQLEQRS